MKLYYSKGACSLAVRIVINELDIDCEFISVDLKAKKLESGEDYLKINSKGAVPAIETEHGLLTENQVIQQYLADTHANHHLLDKVPNFQRYKTLEMLNFISTDIHKGFGPLFIDKFPADAKQNLVIPMLQKKFQFVDKALGNKKYIMGDEFSLPDAYMFVVLRWANKMHIDLSECKNLKGYYERVQQRDSVRDSLEQEGIEA